MEQGAPFPLKPCLEGCKDPRLSIHWKFVPKISRAFALGIILRFPFGARRSCASGEMSEARPGVSLMLDIGFRAQPALRPRVPNCSCRSRLRRLYPSNPIFSTSIVHQLSFSAKNRGCTVVQNIVYSPLLVTVECKTCFGFTDTEVILDP
jgi:hypothetical protein